MSYEKGGRADKFGNRYEYRWVLEKLIDLSNERIVSIIHEPSGDVEDGVDLQVFNRDGIVEFHQCKAKNANEEAWTLSALKNRMIFSRAKKHLDAEQLNTYKFISSIGCEALITLIQRAKNSLEDSPDFYKNHIKPRKNENSPIIEENFKKFLKYMELNIESESDILLARNYLSRMEFIVIPDTEYEKIRLINRISDIFSAEPSIVYNCLINYTIENDRLGDKITAAEINDYLAANQIYKYDLSNHSKIWPRINTLNREFESAFVPIPNGFIDRQEIEDIFSLVLEGASVVVHGKAGSGKSGCVSGLINKLQSNGIPYLALKLDKRLPSKSAKQYGIDLDLPASPPLCLSTIAPSGKCVLILDQLDAIRWTAQHSSTALEVCKELIEQIQRMNLNNPASERISLILVCRTVDCETDNGIKSLFTVNKRRNEQIAWEKILIGELPDESVIEIAGTLFSSFTPNFISLLKNINNLYIWSKLDEDRKKIQYASAYKLIQSYWDQFEKKCYDKGIYDDAIKLKNTLIEMMTSTSRTAIPKELMRGCSPVVKDMAISENIILEANHQISFVHQSFYDTFIVEGMINEIFLGKDIVELMGDFDKQTPILRYQMQMLFQTLSAIDQSVFLSCGRKLLGNEKARYYIKCVFWEVTGQLTDISSDLMTFIEMNLENGEWGHPIIDAVISGHPYYVQHLIDSGRINLWLSSDKTIVAMGILRSVNVDLGDEIAKLLIPFAYQDENMDGKIYSILPWNMEDDTDDLFAFRLELIKYNPKFLENYINFKSIAKRNICRAEKLLETILMAKEDTVNQNIGAYIDSDYNIFEYLGANEPLYVWETILPIIESKTSNKDEIQRFDRGWSEFGVEPTVGRQLVRMAISSGKLLAERFPEKYYSYVIKYTKSTSSVINEIFLYTFISFGEDYSDFVVEWIISDNCIHMYDETGIYDKKLEAVRHLVIKHSCSCTYLSFCKLEDMILKYHDREHELFNAKTRLEHNRGVIREEKGFEDSKLWYWPHWGDFQAYLLPALDKNRISIKAKALIQVLSRNFDERSLGGTKSRVISGCGRSSIPRDVACKFSDNQWIELIQNNKLSDKQFQKKQHYRMNGESSHREFASLYRQVGTKNPERFVKLALKFPSNVDLHYIHAVFSIASETRPPQGETDWKPACFDSVWKAVDLLLHHENAEDSLIYMELCRLVGNRADEAWSNEIIIRIITLALTYNNDPFEERDDSEDLGTSSLNCVRGSAAHAISSLLWEKYERYDFLRPTIEILVYDKNAIIRQAILEAVIATFNIDKPQAEKWFFTLMNSDERIARYSRSIYILASAWGEYSNEVYPIIAHLFYSEHESSKERGARTAANIFIIYDEDVNKICELIFDEKLTEAHLKGIAEIAISFMDNTECREKAKFLLEEITKHGTTAQKLLNSIFYRPCLFFPADLTFIQKMVQLNPQELFMSFTHYVEKNDVPIIDFVDIVFTLCEQNFSYKGIEEMNKGGYYSIMRGMPALISALYDQANGNTTLRSRCLDMWDILYKSNIGNMRAITQQIMDN